MTKLNDNKSESNSARVSYRLVRTTTKYEYQVILNWILSNTTVLDLGCGDGELLSLLIRQRQVKAQGIEINESAIYTCVEKELSVFHGDIDSGLAEYSETSFDYVILDQTFQEVRKPDAVLQEALRVGRHVIVGFPNFGYYSNRFQLAIKGRTPVSPSLPYLWYETPNLHFLTILDFFEYCHQRKIRVENAVFVRNDKPVTVYPNLFAQIGLFLLRK
ncbi:MAG: methionine biosynthesis protein MetW [bacterium]